MANKSQVSQSTIRAGYHLYKLRLKALNQSSLLGLGWELISPLALVGVFLLLFKYRAIEFPDLDIPYPVFLIVGVIAWHGFAQSVMFGINILRDNRTLMQHLRLDPQVLSASAIMWATVLWALKVVAILIGCVFVNAIVPFGIPAFLILTMGISMMGLFIGLFLAPFRIIIPDIEQVVKIILFIMFYLSNTVFPLPETGPLSILGQWNPVALLISEARQSLILGRPPTFVDAVIWAGIFAVFTFISLRVFNMGVKYLRST